MSKVPKLSDADIEKLPTGNFVKTTALTFPNKNKAIAAFPSSDITMADIIVKLHLNSYQAVFLNLGNSNDFDDTLTPQLTQLFSRGIARAAVDADALIIDSGKQTGVGALMGKGVLDRENKSILIGLAAATEVNYQGDTAVGSSLDSNHSHFVITTEEILGNEMVIFYNFVKQLKNKPWLKGDKVVERKVPAVAILTGGDATTTDQVLQAVRLDMNLVVVEGSGGLADEVFAASQKKDGAPIEPAMAEIIAEGKLFFHSLSNSPSDIQNVISSALGVDKVLVQAWETFAEYDLNANRQQAKFDQIQQSIIFIGVIGTTLAIIQEVVKRFTVVPPPPKPGAPPVPVDNLHHFMNFTSGATYIILIIIPITLTILVTVANRFKQGNKWLLLRAAAESIKREIFRYRTRTNDYTTNPEQQLTQKIQDITTRTMRTEVNTSFLLPYDKEKGFPPDMYGAQGGDDGFSKLNPDRYITVRLGDQLNYFKKRSVRLGKQLSILSISIFVVGGIGTFLAAIQQPVWIALTTTIVAAIGTYLGYRQTENTLTKYNQTATNLSNVKAWWNALSSSDQMLQENINTLVEHTEQVLQVELDGWIQQMQNALAELRKNQETKPETNENKQQEEKDKQAAADKDGKAETPPVDGKAGSEKGPAATGDVAADGKEAETPAVAGDTPAADSTDVPTNKDAPADTETDQKDVTAVTDDSEKTETSVTPPAEENASEVSNDAKAPVIVIPKAKETGVIGTDDVVESDDKGDEKDDEKK